MINNSKEIKFSLNGLANNQSYIYEIKSAGGNWPATVCPNSGILIGNESGNTIFYSTVTFCATTGHCLSGDQIGVLAYDKSECAIDIQSIHTSVKLSIIEEATNLETLGYPIPILCTDCFPLIKINKPRSVIDDISLEGFSLGSTASRQAKSKNSIDFYIPVAGLQKFEKYDYSFNSLNMNNWPVIISPISGSITPSTEEALIFASMTFCYPTGNCENNENLLDYVEDHFIQNTSLKNIFNLTISPKSCHGSPVTSGPMSMYCNSCLPKLYITKEPYDITLGPNQGNIADISVQIDGLDNNLEYTYTINSVEGNWPVSIIQASGNIRNRSTINVLTSATFCLSTGECPVGNDKIMDYEVPTNGCLIKDTKYSKMNVSIFETNADNPSSALTRDFTISCVDCLPKTDVEIPEISALKGIGNNTGKFFANLTNLRADQTYSYEIKPIDANWPVVYNPISGIIVTSASNDTDRIQIDYIFCPSTGDCPNGSENVIEYTAHTGSSCVYKNNTEMFSNVQMEISPLSCYDPIIKSDIIKLKCSDCLPKIVVVSLGDISLYKEDGNVASVDMVLKGLEHKRQYSYSFVGSEANWPIIVFPKSGIMEGNFQTDHTISTSVIFCETTGSCSAEDPNLISYSLDIKDTNVYKKLDKLKGKLRFEIQPVSCEEEKIIAEDIDISCYDCLPKVTINTKVATLDSSSYKSSLPIFVDGLSVGEVYNYEIIEQSSNWPTYISPMTGQITSLSSEIQTSINFDLRFCHNTGMCPSGSPNILGYNGSNIGNCNYGFLNSDTKESSFKIQITPQSYNGNVVLSDLIEVKCVDCLPKINISLPNTSGTISNGNNKYSLSSSVGNLIIGQEYSYLFSSTEANWPVTAVPMSGSFIAKSDTKRIVSMLSFCHTTGSCPSSSGNVLDYEIASSCSYGQQSESDLFTKLNLTITPESCGGTAFTSDDFVLRCDTCLNPKIVISTPNLLTSTSLGNFAVQLVGLKPSETYSYSFSGISSNWPTVISPVSGSFKTDKAGIPPYSNSIIPHKYYFCSPTGLCPSGTPGLMNYSLHDYLTQKINAGVLSTIVKMIIVDSSCDTVQTISKEIPLSCDNCLPKSSYASIFFAGGNEIMLPTGCCSGVKTLNVTVNNAIPGEKYSYAFSASDPTVFYPTSGDIYFNTGGSGTINTVGAIDILATGQAMFQCTLTHSSTNISAIDFMSLSCGSGIKVDLCN